MQSIEDLRPDALNFNRHTERGMELLEKSIKENKFGRSILVDKDGNIIAGNATVEAAKKLGSKKIKVIETTGEELVVVKRTDLEIDSKEARELALADNGVAAVNLEWDEDAIQAAKEQFGIVPEDWGVNEKLPDINIDGLFDEDKPSPLGEKFEIHISTKNQENYDSILEEVKKLCETYEGVTIR